MKMRLYELAWKNVKNNIRNYFSLILSLAFTVMIFYNFQNMADSEMFTDLGKLNEDYSKMLIQTLSAVLGAFMIFFVGYATNVFLTRRKKEIGIYLAVGRSKVSIAGQLFAETGIAALIAFAVSVLGSNLWMGKVRELLEGSAADLEIEISAAYLPPVFLIGIGLIAAATLAASWTVFRLKPRDIFSKMS